MQEVRDMALDSIKSLVREHKDKKTEYLEELQFFDAEQMKLDALSAVSSPLDDTIVSAVDDILLDFSIERTQLDHRFDSLRQERDALVRMVSKEQDKLNTVQQKINGISGNKFTGDLEAVSRKCDVMLAELHDMLKDLNDGSAGVGIGTNLDIAGSNQIQKDEPDNPKTQRGIWAALFQKNQAAPSGPKFGSFDLAPLKNGSDFFVMGRGYKQFINDYYHSERSTYQHLNGREIIATISPAEIEGIHLSKTEVADDSVFWRQHERSGTKASFAEIASHIPEVKRMLSAGLSLNAIREYPQLEKCVNIYFDPANIPRVIQSNGYYEFESNGRHRILAAREAGHDIPVKIVGIRRWD